MALVDLHTHSTASDGSDTPSQLLARAGELKLAAIALTDHDTAAGIPEAAAAAAGLGIELVPGIEIWAEMPDPPGVLDILGYFIDPASPALQRMNGLLQAGRALRNEKILARLAELGKPIREEELAELAGGTVTRAHMAKLLIRHRYVADTREAFDVYLGDAGQAFFPKEKLTHRQAIEAIHGAGGLAVLAHPRNCQRSDDESLRRFVAMLVECGLDGLEAFHPDHPPAWARKVQLLAAEFDLCVTGGSDYHGPWLSARPLNCQRVDESFLVKLKDRLAERRNS